MPVPFETFLPYAIMVGMFGITGTGFAVFKTWQNEGKRPRYSLDQWDRVWVPWTPETLPFANLSAAKYAMT
jgi:hypothetical protein